MEFKKPLDEAVWRNIKGYCISCGYLGKRSLYYDEVYEANDHNRTYFSFVSNTSPLPQHSGTLPCCFVNELPLSKEFRELEKKYQRTKDNSEISMEITTRDINCPKWVPYQPFRSPKEHFEDFKEELNRQERKRTNRIMIWLTIALIVFAALQVYAALATINPQHWLFRWLR